MFNKSVRCLQYLLEFIWFKCWKIDVKCEYDLFFYTKTQQKILWKELYLWPATGWFLCHRYIFISIVFPTFWFFVKTHYLFIHLSAKLPHAILWLHLLQCIAFFHYNLPMKKPTMHCIKCMQVTAWLNIQYNKMAISKILYLKKTVSTIKYFVVTSLVRRRKPFATETPEFFSPIRAPVEIEHEAGVPSLILNCFSSKACFEEQNKNIENKNILTLN